MRPCPQCGTPCQEAASSCAACGASLASQLGQTLVGHLGQLARPGAGGPTQPSRVTAPLGPSPGGQTVLLPGGPSATPPGVPTTTLPGGPSAQPPGMQTVTLPGGRSAQPPGGQTVALPGGPSTQPPGMQTVTLPGGPSAPPRSDAPPTGAPAPAPGAAPAPGPAPGHAVNFRGTMVGIGLTSPFAGNPPPPPATPPQSPPPVPPASPHTFKGTMLGLAPMAPMPPEAGAAGAPSPAGDAPAPAPGGRPAPLKTILGIARPGIAPLHPGVEKQQPAAVPEAPPLWQEPPPPPPAGFEPLSGQIPGVPRRRHVPWVTVLVILGAAMLASAGIVAVFFYRARGAIETRLVADDQGRDRLALGCPGCTDGTRVTLQGASTTFSGGKAALTLARPLPVGDNQLELELQRGSGRAEQVSVTVPVNFRIQGDTKRLDETPPVVEARMTARAGSVVVIDGHPVPLSADGTAAAVVDVTRDVTGSEASVKTLERRIPYVVTPPGGTPHNGDVVVRLGIVPLVVQAPGSSIVIEGPGFVLAGHTAKNANVTVEGRPITVDQAGAFAQMMSVSAAGETTVAVRATAPDLAPRLVMIHIRRVQSLSAEAALVRARATASYAAIAADPEGQRGLNVALDGSVVEARTDNYTTLMVMDVKSGCKAPPCLMRVSYGGKLALASGDAIGAFGTLVGSVEGPRSGTRIPAVQADFLLKARP